MNRSIAILLLESDYLLSRLSLYLFLYPHIVDPLFYLSHIYPIISLSPYLSHYSALLYIYILFCLLRHYLYTFFSYIYFLTSLRCHDWSLFWFCSICEIQQIDGIYTHTHTYMGNKTAKFRVIQIALFTVVVETLAHKKMNDNIIQPKISFCFYNT